MPQTVFTLSAFARLATSTVAIACRLSIVFTLLRLVGRRYAPESMAADHRAQHVNFG
jgi:hypothetical protein